MLDGAPLWQVVLVVAALPAVCEELAFRGFILSGFYRPGHKWRAIVLGAVMFGLVHGMFQRTLVAGMVGVAIGFLAVQSGSILPGMLFHVIHNGLSVVWSRIGDDAGFSWPVFLSDWRTIVVSTFLTAAILYWFFLRRRPITRRGTHASRKVLSIVAAIGAFGVIVLGKIVHVTGASTSIPDWPLAFRRVPNPIGAVLAVFATMMALSSPAECRRGLYCWRRC